MPPFSEACYGTQAPFSAAVTSRNQPLPSQKALHIGLKFFAALPHELTDIINIERDRNRELESLRSKTSLVQIARLQNEGASLKKRLSALSHSGFYENYRSIARLNGELKKIESRIETLRMRDASGVDVDLSLKIEKLERDFAVEYGLYSVIW